MKGSIRLDVLDRKNQNYVNGVCDFCGGDRFASHILVIRPQKGLVVNHNEQEIKFCDECFNVLQKVVAADVIRENEKMKNNIEKFLVC